MNALMFIAAGLANEARGVISCPPLIEIQKTVAAVEGWTAHPAQVPHKFYFAQFSDGPPSRQATLIHDRESHSGKHKLLHVTLARRLAPGTRACTVTLDHARNYETVKGISCAK